MVFCMWVINEKEPDHPVWDHPALRFLGLVLPLFHEALGDSGDDCTNDEDRRSEDIEEYDEDGLEHGDEMGFGLMRLVPVTTLVKELAARAVHPW